MKTITQHLKPGTTPYLQAQEVAIANGYNCYSKPHGKDLWDFVTDREEVFYFSRNGQILEVCILLHQADPLAETATQGIISNQTSIF